MSDEPNNATDEPTSAAGLGRDPVLGQAAPLVGSDQRSVRLSDEVSDEGAAASEQQAAHDEIVAEQVAEAAIAAESIAEEPPEPAAPLKVKTSRLPQVEEPEAPGPDPNKRHWYILKVQSNREDSIVEGLERRVKIAGLEEYFGEIIIPIEMVTEFKNGKKRIVKRKLYPGYIMVNMQITDDTWFLVRDTAGIGDFTGSGGKPIPMQAHEVSRLIAKQDEKQEEAPKLKINFKVGDRVKINEGTFENFEGEVHSIDEANGRVVVMINIFGRSTPVELEYWQVESI